MIFPETLAGGGGGAPTGDAPTGGAPAGDVPVGGDGGEGFTPGQPGDVPGAETLDETNDPFAGGGEEEEALGQEPGAKKKGKKRGLPITASIPFGGSPASSRSQYKGQPVRFGGQHNMNIAAAFVQGLQGGWRI